MAEDDLERRVGKLEHDHHLTRWYVGRVDRDLGEIAATQAEHTEALAAIRATLAEHGRILNDHGQALENHGRVLGEHSAKLQEHDVRFDSVDAQLRSLT